MERIVPTVVVFSFVVLQAVCDGVRPPCSELGNITNGYMRNYNTTHGSTVAFYCTRGYTLNGRARISCINDGTWSHPVPECLVVNCSRPPIPRNGKILNPKRRYSYKEYVKFSCKKGYTMKGDGLLKCQNNRKWSSFPPTCVDYSQCGIAYYRPKRRVIRIVGGETSRPSDWPWVVKVWMRIHDGWSECVGTIVNKEYILTAAHALHGHKRPQDIVVSFENEKLTVYTVEKLFIHPKYDRVTFANDIALLKIPQLRFTRQHQAICLPQRINVQNLTRVPKDFFTVGWGTTKPVKTGDHGSSRHRSDELKQVKLPFVSSEGCARYVRKRGWYFNNTTQFCAGDKTGQKDTCSGDAGGPAMVLMKNIDGRWNWILLGIVSWGYGCAQPNEYGYFTRVYAFLDWINRTIAGDNSESSEEPGPKTRCSDPRNSTNAVVIGTDFGNKKKVTFKCQSPYYVLEPYWSRELNCINGKWNAKIPYCMAWCKSLRKLRNGIVRNYYRRHGSMALFICNTGYKLIGRSFTRCYDGNWFRPNRKCLAICSRVAYLRNGVVLGNGNMEGDKIIFRCNANYVLRGHAKMKCQSNRRWNHQKPLCKATCEKITFLINGKVSGGGNIEGDRLSFMCNKGYVLEGQKKITCLSSRKWNGRKPKCIKDYLTCGTAYYKPRNMRARVVGGSPSSAGDWPWMAKLLVKGALHCGATLINKEFILTAAHCLENIPCDQIRISYQDQKLALSGVKKCIIHPEFNSRTLANDIALLKIPKLKRFRRQQQAICSPVGFAPQRLTSASSRLFALGWGGTKQVSKNKVASRTDVSKKLKQVEIPFIGDQKCAESVQSKLKIGLKDWYFNDSTQFCAADESGQSDTCSGDSGGPAMVYMPGRNGRARWFLVGIISWGHGCAQKGEYSYYTRVSAYLHWIDEEVHASCERLPNLSNGFMKGYSLRNGSKVFFYCRRGFKLIGSSWIMCNDSTWSHVVPKCLAICPRIVYLRNGLVLREGNVEGDKISFRCMGDYILEGPASITCRSDRTWDAPPPQCKPSCWRLGQPHNGVITQQGFRHNEQIHFECNQDFVLHGHKVLNCTDGMWDSRPPSCLAPCPAVRPPKNGSIENLPAVFKHGTILHFNCDPNFTLQGHSTLQCLDGLWNYDVPTCKI